MVKLNGEATVRPTENRSLSGTAIEPLGSRPSSIGLVETGMPPTGAGGWPGRTITVPVFTTSPAGRIRLALAVASAEAMPALAAMVVVDEYGNYFIFGILFIIIGFGVVNTVLMSVLHRHREFGVLQALGLTPRQTGSVVFVEGLLLTMVSTLVGVGLGTGMTWYFFGDGLDMTALAGDAMANVDLAGVMMDPIVVPMFSVVRTVQMFGWISLMGVLASVYPAIRASRIDVCESMKFDR